MQTPFVIDWPDELESFPFASTTSLVTDTMLNEEVEKRKKYSTKAIEYIMSLVDRDTSK